MEAFGSRRDASLRLPRLLKVRARVALQTFPDRPERTRAVLVRFRRVPTNRAAHLESRPYLTYLFNLAPPNRGILSPPQTAVRIAPPDTGAIGVHECRFLRPVGLASSPALAMPDRTTGAR